MGRESFLSAHRVTHPELERTGERTATGIWALTDQLVDLQWQFLLQGACFYHDEYRIDPDGRWRISAPDTNAPSSTSPRSPTCPAGGSPPPGGRTTAGAAWSETNSTVAAQQHRSG